MTIVAHFVHVVYLVFGGFGTKGAVYENDVRGRDAKIITSTADGVQVGKLGKDGR